MGAVSVVYFEILSHLHLLYLIEWDDTVRSGRAPYHCPVSPLRLRKIVRIVSTGDCIADVLSGELLYASL